MLKIDELKLSQTLFINKKEVKELYEAGHYVGNHAHSHEARDTMDTKEAEEADLIPSRGTLPLFIW